MRIVLDRGLNHPVPSEITPRHVFENRRALLGALAGAALLPSLPAAAQTEIGRAHV